MDENNYTINVHTIDSKCWNIDMIVADICFAMSLNKNIIIDLMNEGPCLDSIRIIEYLENCASKFNYNLANVRIKTENILKYTHDKIKVDFTPSLMINVNVLTDVLKTVDKTKQTDLVPFGLFIGRGNAPRLHLASFLKQQNEKNIITYHYNHTNEFHIPHVGLDKLIYFLNDANVVNEAKFIKQCPIRLCNEPEVYPIQKEHATTIHAEYTKFFVEVVCETYFSGTTFYPTEKIWRPIMLKTPFIVQGPANYLNNLKALGFKTFSNWWDEGYSEDPPNYGIHLIKDILDELNSKTSNELYSMYTEMQPVLQHNYDLLHTLTTSDLVKLHEQK